MMKGLSVMTRSHYISVGYKSPLILLTIKRVLAQSEKTIEPETCFQDMQVFSTSSPRHSKGVHQA